MKPQIFTRQGKTITDLRSNQPVLESSFFSIQFKSANLAKKESFKIQMSRDKALGLGSLRLTS